MQHRRLPGIFVGLLGASLGLGCTANIDGSARGADGPGGPDGGLGGPGGSAGGPGGPGTTPGSCQGGQVGPERIDRLTPAEYKNTLRALMSDDSLDPVLDADRQPIATLDAVRKWFNAADSAVSSAPAWLSSYGSCDPNTDHSCATVLYEAFAERAFRRPLTDDERSWLSDSYAALPARASIAQKLETISELILQAPQYLYLYTPGTAQGAVNVLGGYERAQRLAYFLWDGPPDQALLKAAGGGVLDTPAGMRETAASMLADERAKPVLRSFLADWLELDGATILPGLEETPKDADLYGGFDDVLRQSMRREIEMFMDHVMFEKDGSLETLFTGTRAYVNAPLAQIYGVSGPKTASDWAWVDLDPSQRAGMLTRAGFLAVHASQSATSPIRRGVYMLKEVLCVELPSPPANVDNSPIEVTKDDMADGITTVREATLKRTGSPTCGACHTSINELGFAFEHYDAIGRWQQTEVGSGGAIDATANLSHAGDGIDGPVDGAVALSAKLAKSPAVAQCATRKWFEVALRRSPVALDACSVEKVQAKVAETQSIRELLLTMVESEAFLEVNHGE